MDVYVYQAALLCGRCAESSEFRCGLIAAGKNRRDGFRPLAYGPYSNGGDEADTPQHCDQCKVFLENPLTEDGMRYVNTQAIPYMDEAELPWSEIADRAEVAGKGALAEWIRFYFMPGV